MARRSSPPLPVRNGLGPTKIVLGKTLQNVSLAYALSQHTGHTEDEMRHQCQLHNVVTKEGVPLSADDRVDAIMSVFVYREPRPEKPVPFEMTILAHTERFVIIDKPHFLSTIPRGMHITETVLIKARQLLGCDTLSPAHRLDRLTAGVLLLTTLPQYRGAYQQLFAHGKVTKIYRALADPPDTHQVFPLTVESRIEKTPGIMRAYETSGEPNAYSIINHVGEQSPGVSEYELQPLTGKTHQLRMHMWKINRPIHGDPLYPVDILSDSEDFSTPLHLRAHSLEFIDPYTHEHHRFTSQRTWITD